ncbi:MAG: DUF697 domain-containing protein [Clostridiaceae bacterium]
MEIILKPLKGILIYLAISILLLLVIFAINETASLYTLTRNINPYLGYFTLGVLILAFGMIIFVPLYVFFSIRKKPEMPESVNSPDYGEYLQKLKLSLSENKYLKQENFMFDEQKELKIEVERAMIILETRANEIVKKNASSVFITTAVSQNGSLDGIFVLSSMSKMVWDIAHIFNQRPSLREVLYLYGNIGATVLMARGIEDMDLLDDQLEPVIASILGGGFGSLIPGAVYITNLIVNSISEGSVNALLSLRVGAMTKRYCTSTTVVDKKLLRRSASYEAVSLLGGIIKDNTGIIISSFASAARGVSKKILWSRFSKEENK